MGIKTASSIALAALALAGCATTPRPSEPPLAVPAAFKTPSPGAATIQPDGWWTRFGDPTLDRLVAQAEQGSPSVATALLRVERAASLAGIEASALLPEIDFLATAGRSRQSGVTANRFFASLQLDWEIDLFGRIRSLKSSAEAEAQAEADAYAASLNLLRSQVAQAYFSLRSLDRSIGILEATIAVRADALRLVEIRLNSGLSDELEVAQARTEHSVARAELQRVIGQRRVAENTLATLVGSYASEFRLDLQPQWQANIPELPRAIPSELLMQRPDLSQARRLVQAASERIGARVAEFYPSISIGGEIGYAASAADRWFRDSSRLWSAGPSLDLPIFRGKERRHLLERAQIEYRSLVEAYRSLALQAFEDVESDLALVEQLGAEFEELRAASTSARRAAAMARQRYDSGLVSYLEVVDTERAALNATLRENAVEVQKLARIAQLVTSLGAGWPPSE